MNILSRVYRKVRRMIASRKGSAAYWTVHMVANKAWRDAEDSLDHFHWRNAQSPGYIELLPVSGYNDKVILDYGCGPGNDVVGFSVYSNPKKLYAADVSSTAIATASRRLALHGKSAEFVQLDEIDNKIAIESESVDHIHSAGVLHHCANLPAIIAEFHRILKPTGDVAVMIYNNDSLWLHLFTAYIHQIELGKFKNDTLLEAFRKTTDGEECPIAHCYKPQDFINIFARFGFKGEYLGSSISVNEMQILPKRFDAIYNRQLNAEHRNFLSELEFDNKGIPYHSGQVAGINGCFRFTKI
jgi:ubiquinone/menaquinone biosynthesis C-methylase UbiE